LNQSLFKIGEVLQECAEPSNVYIYNSVA